MEEQLSTASETEKTTTQKKKPKRAWRIIKIFLLLFLAVLIVGGGAAAGYVATLLKKTPALDLNAITNMAATTKVYDSDKQLMFTLQGDGDRDVIKSLDQVSPYVTEAFIAAEDKNFYSHHGINPLAMARAAVQDVLGHGIVSGASTITQQTIKNAVFPEQDRTLERKVQEAYLAIELEKKLTKNEILTAYLNWIYFGQSGPNNLYGIEAASKGIFGIPAKNLNLAQATLLASLPNNPSIYNPYEHLDAALQRQDYILNEMLKDGYITQQQLNDAKKYDIAKDIAAQKKKTQVQAGAFGHLNPEIEQEAAQKLFETGKYDTLDDAKQALYRGGYSIYTTINRKMQNAVDQTINDNSYYPPNVNYTVTDNTGKTIQVTNAMEQAGATLIDNKTGKILAMGGGRDYAHDQVNHATQPRQPGSTMKPIGVYGPAIDLKQIGSGTAIDDVPTVWPDPGAPNGKYFPMNWDNRFHGLMTVRTALEQSYNIPALKVFSQITPKVGLDYVRKMGITTLTDADNNLAAGIGGLSHGLTVTEETSAYTTFPDAGTHHDAYMIEEITDRNGTPIYQHQSKTEPIFNPNTAYIMNDMLKGVVKRGTAASVGAKFPNLAIAGKTGTTNDDKDAWFIGYTPDVTLGIWVGYDIPKTLDATQTHLPLTLWNGIMSKVLPDIPNRSSDFFPNPGGVRQVAVCKYSGKLPTDLCQKMNGVTNELFIAGTEPHQLDDVLVQAKYYEVGGKKYLATDATPPGMVKEGIFIKRQKYVLPDNNTAFLPTDWQMEYPGDGNAATTETISNGPTGLQVTAATANSVRLSWNSVNGAKSYVVLRADSAAGPYQIQNSVNTTSYTDTTVQAGKTYYYKVVSTDSSGVQSDPSAAVSADTGSGSAQSGLEPPSQVNVAPGPVGLTISWSAVPGASGYTIYRSTDPNGNYQKIGTGADTSYTDIGALPGTTFYYKVTASNGGQESNASAPVSATVPASGASDGGLEAPGSISTSNPHTGNSLVISWSAVAKAAGYSLERSSDGTNWREISNGSATTYTDTGLTTDQKYYYRVRAIGGNNQASAASAAAVGIPTKS